MNAEEKAERKRLIDFKKYLNGEIKKIDKELKTKRPKPIAILDEYEELLINNIIDYCEEKYKFLKGDIKGVTRKHEVVFVRQTIQYWLKFKCVILKNKSLKNIGAIFGGRDHSTVIHSLQCIEDFFITSKHHTRAINELMNYFTNVIEKRVSIEMGQKEWDENKKIALDSLTKFNDYANASF